MPVTKIHIWQWFNGPAVPSVPLLLPSPLEAQNQSRKKNVQNNIPFGKRSPNDTRNLFRKKSLDRRLHQQSLLLQHIQLSRQRQLSFTCYASFFYCIPKHVLVCNPTSFCTCEMQLKFVLFSFFLFPLLLVAHFVVTRYSMNWYNWQPRAREIAQRKQNDLTLVIFCLYQSKFYNVWESHVQQMGSA